MMVMPFAATLTAQTLALRDVEIRVMRMSHGVPWQLAPRASGA